MSRSIPAELHRLGETVAYVIRHGRGIRLRFFLKLFVLLVKTYNDLAREGFGMPPGGHKCNPEINRCDCGLIWSTREGKR